MTKIPDDSQELDDAIEHAKEVARTTKGLKCAKEHEQLAKWLEELKTLRESAMIYTSSNSSVGNPVYGGSGTYGYLMSWDENEHSSANPPVEVSGIMTNNWQYTSGK